MSIPKLRISRLSLAMFVILAGLISFLPACHGGGGGGSGAEGISYTGMTTPVSLTAANANIMFSAMWNGGSSSGSAGAIYLAPARSKAGTAGSSTDGAMSLVKRLGTRVSGDVAGFSGASKKMNRATPINETLNGKTSGTRTVAGSIDASTGKGALTITYVNFNDWEANTYDGVVTVTIDGYDPALDIITDMTMRFTWWSIKWAGGGVLLNGTMRLQESWMNQSDTLTVNMDGLDAASNESFRFENFAETTTYNSLLNPSYASEVYSGRVYLEKFGFVEVSTSSPCVYSNYPNGQDNPDGGGPLFLAGAGNSKARITPVYPIYVSIEVDADGDSVFESGNAYIWSDLGGEPLPAACIADAGPDQAVSAGSLVILDGSGSVNRSGGTLTYEWTITSKPDGSWANLSSSSTTVTAFMADLPGTYTITLVVRHGTTESSQDTAIITATGTASGGVVLTSVSVTPQNPNLAKGATQQFTATGIYSDGTTANLTLSTIWASSDATKLTISSTGSATATGYGSATITATSGNIMGSTVVTVVDGFLPGIKYPNPYTGSSLGNTAVGDLNGDGRNDVAVLEMGGGSRILVYYQNSRATLDPPQIMDTYLSLHGIAIADINNDGLDDLVVSGNSQAALLGYLGRVVVFRQDQTSHALGHSQDYTLSTNNLGPLALADLNNDGLPDIITTGGIVSLMFQGLAGALSSEVTYTNVSAVPDGEVHVADMDNDGLNDIVLQSGQKQLAVIRQTSPGTLSAAPDFYTVQTSYWPFFNSFALGDLNGDGRTDMAVADLTGYLNIFYQNTNGMLTGPAILSMYPATEVHIADVNDDGLNDIILLNSGNEVKVLYQAADHSSFNQAHYSLPTFSSGGTPVHQALSVGDVTGNGLSDIVASWSNEGIFVLER